MSTMKAIPIVPPYTPELLESVQSWIEGYLEARRQPIALEYGSGWSTVWLADRVGYLVSLEHDSTWYREVCLALGDRTNISYLLTPTLFDESVSGSSPYDLVYIDCVDEQRIACLEKSLQYAKGIVVVDDTHWPSLAPVFSIMCNYPIVYECQGMHIRKTDEICFHKTTIWDVSKCSTLSK